MSCLFIVTTDFRSISYSITTSSASINYFLGLITKNVSLVVYGENKSYSRMTRDLMRYQEFQQ